MYRKLSFMLYSLGCFAAIGACVIVNLAVSGTLTWAMYPLLSVPFAWAVGAPLWVPGWNRAVPLAMLAFTVLVPPYLYLLAGQTGGGWFLPLGLPCAGIGLASGWAAYALWRFAKIGFFYKLALCVLLTGALVGPAINWLAHRFAALQFDALDMFINIFASVLAAGVLAILGFVRAAKEKQGK